MLQKLDDVDAIFLEHSSLGQVDPVHLEQCELISYRIPPARQEARSYPVRDFAEAQIDARRLNLVISNRLDGTDFAPWGNRFPKQLRGKQTGGPVSFICPRFGKEIPRGESGHPR